MNDEFYMKKALALAENAFSEGEFPVGCVFVYDDKIIVTGQRINSTGTAMNEIDHAEMIALRKFSNLNTDIDKSKTTVFCTLEPCLMCFAALLLSGVGKIVYAYEDIMGGGTNCDLTLLSPLYRSRKIIIESQIMRADSIELFKKFFNNPKNEYWKGSLLARYTLEQ